MQSSPGERWLRGVAPSIPEQSCDCSPRQLQAPCLWAVRWGCFHWESSHHPPSRCPLCMAAVSQPRSGVRALHSGSPLRTRAVVAVLLPSSLEPILLAPALGAGCGSGPTALEKPVFAMAPGKRRSGGGKMEPFPLWDFPMSKERHPALWNIHREGESSVSLGQRTGLGVPCP